MSASKSWLIKQGDLTLTEGDFRVILCNLTTSITPTTPEAEILAAEAIQVASGYQAQAFTQTSVTWDEDLGYVTASQAVSFTAPSGGDPYQYNFVGIWQGRGANSNKPATVDPATDQATVPIHGCVNGDRGFIVGATQPTGMAIVSYYLKAIDANTLEFYTDQALTTKVNIQDTGVGSLRFVYANGCLVDGGDEPLSTVQPGVPHNFTAVYYVRG